MSNPRITIKDIAKKLNVHHSTVSRALRDDERVRPETRELIKKYAKDLGYQVNMSALHLRGGGRNVIAVVVPNINHRFFSNIISRITDLANEQGLVVSIFQTNEKYQQEKDVIGTVIKNNVAGVIASVSMETINGEHFKELHKYGIPLVLFDRVVDIDVPCVLVDNVKIVFEVVQRLAKKGYKKIAHISGVENINVFSDRQKGYLYGVEKFGLNYKNIIQLGTNFDFDDGRDVACQILSEKERPDAIICDSYQLVLGILSIFQEQGIKVPEDIGIIGSGEDSSMEVMKPRISAIVQPGTEVATKAFDVLVNLMNEKDFSLKENIVLPATLIERDSY